MLFKHLFQYNTLLRLSFALVAYLAMSSSAYSQCVITTLNTLPGPCETGDVYSLSGDLTIANPPAGGTLVIEVDNGTATFDTIILPPFLAAYNFSISNIPSNGAASNVTAFFSANPLCTIGPLLYNAPASCACVADVGTVSASLPGGPTNTFTLCFDDVLQLSSNNDFTPPNQALNPPGPAYDPNIGWLVYSCPPTIGLTPSVQDSIVEDPCFEGLFNVPTLVSSGNSVINAFPAGTFTNNTVYLVPVTLYSASTNTVSWVNTSLPCYSTGPLHTIQYLPDFASSNIIEDCIAGTATITVNGGLPQLDGSLFTASNLQPATASFTNTTAADGATIEITGLTGGDLWSFDITDANGCVETINGGPFPPRDDPGFFYPNGPSFCSNDILQNPTITGAVGGTFTAVPAGLVIDANSGEIDPTTSTAGIYDVTYTTPNICFDDSTITITVTEIPTVDPIADQSVCANEAFNAITFTGSNAVSMYDWTNDNTAIGQPFTGVGDILAFTPPINPNTTVANFTVTPSVNGCLGAPENFTLTFEATADPSFIISDLVLCPNGNNPQTTIIGAPGGAFTFVAISGGPSLEIDATTGAIDVALSDIGSYDVTYTTTGNCPGSSTVNLNVLEVPVVDPIVNQTICELDAFATINFTGGITGTVYNWTNNNTATGLAAAGAGNILAFSSPPVAVTEVSNIVVTPSVMGGCVGNSETFMLTVQATDDPSFVINNTVSCQNDNNPTTTITGTAGGTFTALANTAGSVLDIDATTGAINLATSNPGVFDVTYTTNGACPASSVVSITVLEVPVLQPLADQSVCENEPLTIQNFSASTGTIFNWNNTGGVDVGFGLAGNGQIGSFTAINNIPAATTTVIEVTPESPAGCIGTPQTFSVLVNNAPDVSFVSNTLNVCSGDEVLFINTTPVVPFQTFLWDFGNGTSTLSGDVLHVFDEAGSKDVSLTVTSLEGCAATETFFSYIDVAAKPVPDFTFNDQNVTATNSLVEFINQSINATDFIWDFGDNSDPIILEDPEHEFPNTSGTYTVQLTAIGANPECVDSIRKVIVINDGVFFYIPNVFTPENVGTNNIFTPTFSDGVDPYEFTLTIYNRWGEIIFQSFDKEGGWDGRYGGNDRFVETGVYVWRVDFKEKDTPENLTVNGHVTVLR